ncbi:adenine phosphoribosyltransferase [Helicobacter sp. 13S00477-4]|uniref:adenine phosphoribosyltransferase n=1 Tax=Helicobacter sp. 13S00477-4 TaxID=1905759 RepID=UPI000BA5B4DC|nr:adenine phosphoribosyltransferase [Helicobacter sp. 13S00477-4]PAF52582.1 adenine phosphoribosyltransferase [Helicobacter sp. 13S00477-4]
MQPVSEKLKKELLASIRSVIDYPKPGIVFRDITTLINNPILMNALIDSLKNYYLEMKIDFVVGIESRGFIFGAALAYALSVGFVPVRKKGKLPFTVVSEKYSLEYGFDEVEIHIDAFRDVKSPRVILIDDLIATGGTAQAALRLIESLGANCVEACFLLNLESLGGAKKLREIVKVTNVLDIEVKDGD